MTAPLSPGELFQGAPAPSEALDHKLQALWERGRAAWPGVDVPLETFVRHLSARRPPAEDAAAFLETVHADGLYLACACAEGDARALGLFEARLLSQAPRFLARLALPPDRVAEVQQLVREKLFVAAGAARPRIADYSGEGPLGSWLRAVTLRTAISLLRQRDDRALDDQTGDDSRLAVTEEPELRYLRSRYQAEFKQALRDAISLLGSEQRTVLRMHFIDGLSIDRIAPLFQVHRATAARWLQGAREAILLHTRRLLQEGLKLPPAELDSLIRVLHVQLDISIGEMLRTNR